MNNFLKYGDLILLYMMGDTAQVGSKKNLSTPHGPYGGLLTAFGYIDNGLYYHQLQRPLEGSSVTFRTPVNFANMKDAVFMVTPKLNYDFHKDMKKTMKMYHQLDQSIEMARDETKENLIVLKSELLKKIEKLNVRMKIEQQLNQALIRDAAGTIVHFGAEIQLMHYNSKSFLGALPSSSKTRKIGFNCVLSNWFSSSMIFKTIPKFKSRLEGDKIQIRDHILLYNLKTDAYLNIASQGEMEIMDDKNTTKQINPFLIKTQVVDPNTERSKAYMSQDILASFQIIIYQRYENQTEESNGRLMGGDLVRIVHTESEADLAADIAYDGEEDVEVFLRRYKGEIKEEISKCNSYWIVEHRKLENAGEFFPITPNKSSLKPAASLRLRHFLTNKLISVDFQNEDKEQRVVLSEDGSQHISFLFEPVIKNDGYLYDNHAFYIREAENLFFMNQIEGETIKLDIPLLSKKLAANDAQYKFQPLLEEDVTEDRYRCEFSKEFSSKDAYLIKKVSLEEETECRFIRSALPILKYVTSHFEGRLKDIPSDVYERLLKVLNGIICFLFDIESTSSIDLEEIQDNPIPTRQKLAKDMGLIDALVEFLYCPFRNKSMNLEEAKQSSLNIRVLQRIYLTIMYAIKEYRPNELYSSQWIQMFIEQTLISTKTVDILAGRTLKELVDNNRRILETRIGLDQIKLFINFLKHSKTDGNLIELLRALCICNDQPMIKIQQDISELLLVDEEVRAAVLIQVLVDPLDGIVVTFDSQGYYRVKLLDLETFSLKHDNGRFYKYFLSFIPLMTDLCANKNYLAIDILQKVFPFQVCDSIIKDNDYTNAIRVIFVNLMCNLWMDVYPFQKVVYPKSVKIWEEKLAKNIFVSETTAEIEKFVGLKKFILKFLRR
jgi:inositol 1,4,5-triphosphate receptor type 3